MPNKALTGEQELREKIASVIRNADFSSVGSYFIADQILALITESLLKARADERAKTLRKVGERRMKSESSKILS